MVVKIVLVVLAMLTVSLSNVYAQDKLIIAKPFKPAKYEFHQGEEIRFRLKGEKHWNKGYIIGLGDNVIKMHYNTILLEEIEAIDVSEKYDGGIRSRISWVSTRGGTGFYAISQVNRNLVFNQSGFDATAFAIGSSIAVGGLLLKLLYSKKVKIGKKYLLRIDEM